MSSSSASSPHRFSGSYDSFYSDAAAAAASVNSQHQDINARMKVPKRLRVTGDHDDSPSVNWSNYSKEIPEKLSMNVPDRIMVTGGSKQFSGVPRELELEATMLPRPPDPALYRVQTPPRTITLSSYPPDHPQEEETPSSPHSSSSRHPSQQSSHPQSTSGLPPPYDAGLHLIEGQFEAGEVSPPGPILPSSRTPSTLGGAAMTGEELTPVEELQLLRRQVGRLNRRVMALELDTQQRSQREMIVYALSVAYCVIKSLIWLNRT